MAVNNLSETLKRKNVEKLDELYIKVCNNKIRKKLFKRN